MLVDHILRTFLPPWRKCVGHAKDFIPRNELHNTLLLGCNPTDAALRQNILQVAAHTLDLADSHSTTTPARSQPGIYATQPTEQNRHGKVTRIACLLQIRKRAARKNC